MRSLFLYIALVAAGCSAASAGTAAPGSTTVSTRSSLAGTWNVSIPPPTSGQQIGFVLHLHGSDDALTGVSSLGAQITGDFAGGVLRLNLATLSSGASTATLLDCTLSSDTEATCRAVGNVNGTITMTRGS